MKVAKLYLLTILPFRNLAVVTHPKNKWAKYIQKNATVTTPTYECDYKDLLFNIRLLQSYGTEVIVRKR